MNKLFMFALIINIFYSGFLLTSETYYIKEIKYSEKYDKKNKKNKGLSVFTKDSLGQYYLISEHKNPIGWRLNSEDLVYLTNSEITVEIEGEKGNIISLKTDGNTPAYFINNQTEETILYQEFIGDFSTNKFKYSDFTFNLISPDNYGVRSINDYIAQLERTVTGTALARRGTIVYLKNVVYLSLIYIHLGELKKAESILKSNLDYADNITDSFILSYFYLLLGDINYIRDSYFDTLTYYGLGVENILTYTNAKTYEFEAYRVLLYSHIRMGLFYEKYREINNALNFYIKSQDINKKILILEKKSKIIKMYDYWIALKIEDNKNKEETTISYGSVFETLLQNDYDTNYSYDYKLMELYDRNLDYSKIEGIIKKYPNDYGFLRKQINYIKHTLNNNEFSDVEKINGYNKLIEICKSIFLNDSSNFEVLQIIIDTYNRLFNLKLNDKSHSPETLQILLEYMDYYQKIYFVLNDDYQVVKEYLVKLIYISEYYKKLRDYSNILNNYIRIIEFSKNAIKSFDSSEELKNIYTKYLAMTIQVYILRGEYDLSLKYNRELVDFLEKDYKSSQDIEKIKDYTIAIDFIGYNYICLGDFKNALINFELAFQIRKDKITDGSEKIFFAISNINIGDVYFLRNDFIEAKSNYTEALENLENNNDKVVLNMSLLPVIYERLGNVSIKLSDIDKAKDFYQRDLDLSKKIYEQDNYSLLNHNYLGISLNNISNLFLLTNKTSQSLDYYRQALGIFTGLSEGGFESNENNHKIGFINSNIGIVKQIINPDDMNATENLKNSILSFEDVIKSHRNINNIIRLSFIYKRNGDYYYNRGLDDEAIYFYNEYFKTLKIIRDNSEKIGNAPSDALSFLSANLNLANIYSKRRDIPKAKLYYDEVYLKSSEFLKVNPDMADFLKLQAVAKNKLGNLYFNIKDFKNSIKKYEESLLICERLRETEPVNIDYVIMYCNNLYNIGITIKLYSNATIGNKKLQECLDILSEYASSNNEQIRNLISMLNSVIK